MHPSLVFLQKWTYFLHLLYQHSTPTKQLPIPRLSPKGNKSFKILSMPVFWGALSSNILEVGRTWTDGLVRNVWRGCFVSKLDITQNVVDRRRSTRKRRDRLNPNCMRHCSFRLFTSSSWIFSYCFDDSRNRSDFRVIFNRLIFDRLKYVILNRCVKSFHPFYTFSTIRAFTTRFSLEVYIFPSYILSALNSDKAASNT